LNTPTIANAILASLPDAEYKRLQPNLDVVSLQLNDVLCKRGEHPQYAYFPLNSVLSLQASATNHPNLSVAMVGREGNTGLDIALGSDISQFNIVVLGEGFALRMKSKAFGAEFHESKAMRQLVLAYGLSLEMQIAQTSACLHFHHTEARLASCLLTAGDYFFSDHLLMTHSALGNMLGVRRVVLTIAALALKSRHLIEYTRGELSIMDKVGLRAVACSCYHPTVPTSVPLE
jgi:CRP-like cAMP-binding protein